MIIVVLALLGLALGSFVNALVWRVHKQAKTSSKSKAKNKKQADLSILHGRSMCTDCGHQLAALDLVPVISWAALGRKCRYCHRPISWQYPLVEILMALLFVGSYLFWPEPVRAGQAVLLAVWLAQLVVLMALAVYDFRWFLLPNRLMVVLAGFAGLQTVVQLVVADNAGQSILASLVAALVGGGIFWVLFQISDGKLIGGGDVKLGFLLGLIVGTATGSFLVIFLASVIGTVLALPGLVTGMLKTSAKLPFGPLLIVATVIVKLFSDSMIAWYKGQVGL